MRSIIQQRRAQPREDLLSQLIQAREASDRLSEDEIVSTAILLLNAGHEATVHALGHAIALLIQAEPSDRAAWLAAPAPFVEEVLRFAPPLHMFTRYVLEDCELFGVPLRVGDQIGLHLGMANRDPRAMPQPDTFDPTRQPVKQVAFGAGIHFCIGHALARLELETALPLLFARHPEIALQEAPTLRNAYHFHGYEALTVQLGPARAA